MSIVKILVPLIGGARAAASMRRSRTGCSTSPGRGC